MNNPMITAFDIIIGGGNGSPTRLGKGTAGQLLTSSSSGVRWVDLPPGEGGSDLPSDTYIDLTPGSSGASYTVSKDGWINVACTTQNTNAWLFVANNDDTYRIGSGIYSTGKIIYALCPVAKNDVFKLNYENVVFDIFRLIYSKGEA